MRRRFVAALLSAFLLTLGVLAGAGYAITQVAVAPQRDMFRTGYFDFELAPQWWCQMDEAEYVCLPAGKPPHPAIAIIALKQRGAADNLAAYEQHLSQPQRVAAGNGNAARLSEIKFVRRRIIGAHEWVEGLHTGSEVRDFDTYYLATATSMIGILVTLSVHKDHADKYIGQLNDMIRTLSIYQR